jgi:ribosomal subunit interface protein
MKIPLQITLRDIPHSDAIEAAIREKAEKLDRFYQHVMSCRVTVEMLGKHKHQGKEFNVRIDITVPGSELVVNRIHHEDIYVVLRDAFDAARRQLEDYGRKQHGDVKTHEPAFQGRIARLFGEEGYGFIQTPDGQELYFSRENLVNIDFERLEPGLEVRFIEEAVAEGLQAKRISVSKHGTVQ